MTGCNPSETPPPGTSSSSSSGGGTAGAGGEGGSGGKGGAGGQAGVGGQGGGAGQGGAGGQGGGNVPIAEIDTTYGFNGYAYLDRGESRDVLNAACEQSSGRLIAVGTTTTFLLGEAQILVSAWTSDGQPDLSFGDSGKLLLPILLAGRAHTLICQPDNSLLLTAIAGTGVAKPSAEVIIKLTENGKLDSAFGNGKGYVFNETLAPAQWPIARLDDGKIVIAMVENFKPAIRRYLANGSIDSSFGQNGTLNIMSSGSAGSARGIVVQKDGAIVAAYAGPGSNPGVLVRITSAGMLDSTFGMGGMTPANNAEFSCLALTQDGKIVLASGIANGTSITRYMPDGSLDLAFGGSGYATVSGLSNVSALAVDSNGSILVGGATNSAIARVAADGTMDTAFGSMGGMAQNVLGPQGSARTFVLRANGEIVAVGQKSEGSVDNRIAAAAALSASGAALMNYGSAGIGRHPSGAAPETVTRMAVDKDGSVVVLAKAGPSNSFFLRRLGASGTVDATFTDPLVAVGGAMALASDGSVFLGTLNNFIITKRNPTGTLDTTFGSGGATLPVGSTSGVYSVMEDAQGRILAGGLLNTPSNGVFTLARYTSNGILDTTFAGDGMAAAPPTANAIIGTALALQSDGKILVGTSPKQGGAPSGDSFILRYGDDGTVDTTFAAGGAFQLPSLWHTRRLVSLADGSVLAAGFRFDCAAIPCARRIELVKLSSSGQADLTFGNSGFVSELLDALPPMEYFLGDGPALAVLPNGNIVVGDASRSGDVDAMMLLRLTPSGKPDLTFGAGGKQKIQPNIGNWTVRDLAILPDGKWLVATNGFHPASGTDPVIMRFLP